MPGEMGSSWVTERENKRRREEPGSYSAPSGGAGSRSKRFKYGLALATVYASTLTKLRSGAKNFFQTSAPSSSLTSDIERMDISSEDLRESSANAPVATLGDSAVILSVANSSGANSMAMAFPQPNNDICENCMRNRRNFNLTNAHTMETCSFCDKRVCHLNQCVSCNSGFCSNCSYHRYEDGFAESFVCTDCFQ